MRKGTLKRIRFAREEELPPATLMSRREMFSFIGKRTKDIVGSVIPDDGSVKVDGMLYRKLLTKRLKELCKRDGNQAFGWRTLVFTEHCWGCGICAKVCPHEAITVVELGGKKYMAHSLWKCEGCGICQSVCLEKGLSGMRTVYIKDPLQPVLTEIAFNDCELCGKPVKPGTGGFCYVCAMKRYGHKSIGSPFFIAAP